MTPAAWLRRLEDAAPAAPQFDFAPVLADDRVRAVLAEVPAWLDRMPMAAARAELARRVAEVLAHDPA